MLAVAALTAVGFFADRLNSGLARDARQLLGGDAIVASDQPAPPAFVDKAPPAAAWSTATTASFPSMGRAPDDKGGASRLVGVKAVSDGYPLRGRLRCAARPDGRGASTSPARPRAARCGSTRRCSTRCSLKVGDTLLLGDATLRIARVIVIEPDRGAGFIELRAARDAQRRPTWRRPA